MKILWCLAAAVAVGGGLRANAVPVASPPSQPAPLYENPNAPVEARVQDLLGRLTEPEKLSLLALQSHENAQKLDTPPIPRLNVPELRTSDAPNGIRDGKATSFPMGVVMASTWDPALIQQVGAAIGQEARAKNRQVIYGPDVNIQRSPQSGRSFECYSEDPHLSARMAIADIEGIQSQGVSACVKHFICNDEETDRHSINIRVSERALHEIYLPPFKAAIQEAHVWSLMPSFNQVNGEFMAQNIPLLHDLVLTHWGWDGLVISDWGAVHDTVPAVDAGTDIEMPDPVDYAPAALTAALSSGKITQAQIDDMVRRVLRCMVRTGRLNPSTPPDASAVNSPAHQALALKVAQEGAILLKNQANLLPLNAHRIKSIAVIGPNASDTQLGGRWSADVVPFSQTSVLQGIQNDAGSGVSVQFALGCPRTKPGTPADLSAAVALAAKSDVAVVVVGMDNNYEGEELDPPNIDLPGDQAKLIEAVAAANKNTIVVLNNGTPVLMTPWITQIRGIIEGWYAGQAQGQAVADILFGKVNPSGHLTETIAKRREDYSDFGFYPGYKGVMTYGEGIYVGYRHFDKDHIAPLFPFGFGLSYTTFQFGGLKAPAVLTSQGTLPVRLHVKNVGSRAGAEVVQLYIHPLNPRVDRPVQELKRFERVSLQPGQTKTVAFSLDRKAFSYWDTTHHRWEADPGQYELIIGASSRDVRLRTIVHLD